MICIYQVFLTDSRLAEYNGMGLADRVFTGFLFMLGMAGPFSIQYHLKPCEEYLWQARVKYICVAFEGILGNLIHRINAGVNNESEYCFMFVKKTEDCWQDTSFAIFVRMIRFVAILLLFLTCSVQAQQREVELWNRNKISVKLTEKLKLRVAENVHYSTLRGDFNLKYAELFVGHEAKSGLEFGGGYRRASYLADSDLWENENRATLYINLSEPVEKFRIVFSNKLEYRSFKHLNDYFRNRQAIKFEFPLLTAWGMRFYLTEESFFKFNAEHLHMVRFFAGLTVLKKQHFNISTYYGLQESKLAEKWFGSDILGLNLNISI